MNSDPSSRTAPLSPCASRTLPIAQRATCLGCASLAQDMRPRCTNEASPHFRSPRETYHDRCAAFASVRASRAETETPPMSRFQVAGEAPGLKRRRS